MARLYSYVVARDYGFAPNPFYGYCTLACCKPKVRKAAQVGDWVIGTGAKLKQRRGHLVYAMRVTETMTFDDYWMDPRFLNKRPGLTASRKKAFGDNIYRKDPETGEWLQLDSHHSCDDGTPDWGNVSKDTKPDRVLISDDFVYWGGAGPALPLFRGVNLCKKGQGHKCDFPDNVVEDFIKWIRSLDDWGYCGRPLEWR